MIILSARPLKEIFDMETFDNYITGIIDTLLGIGNTQGSNAYDILNAIPTFAPQLVPVDEGALVESLLMGSGRGILCRRAPIPFVDGAPSDCIKPPISCSDLGSDAPSVFFVNGYMVQQNPKNAPYAPMQCRLFSG